MTLDALIMILGAFIALLPFLGFPMSWDNVFSVIVGILVLLLGIAVRRNVHKAQAELRHAKKNAASTFVENTPPSK